MLWRVRAKAAESEGSEGSEAGEVSEGSEGSEGWQRRMGTGRMLWRVRANAAKAAKAVEGGEGSEDEGWGWVGCYGEGERRRSGEIWGRWCGARTHQTLSPQQFCGYLNNECSNPEADKRW